MDFDCITLNDEPYDFNGMASVIDAYDETIDASERYTRVYDGSHLYYQYTSRLLELLLSGASPCLRLSLHWEYDRVRTSFLEIYSTPSPSESNAIDLSSVHSIPFADDVPLELWEEIFNLLPHQTLLVSRCVYGPNTYTPMSSTIPMPYADLQVFMNLKCAL
ncbi:hypothetical protein EV421DRAFT_1910327 [Armillaria borealis]|uniref:Uncharacterized protein n=1 Tax=Armillaria borealis TaxID=47425 RepID=A0AA39IZ45_9AGAR|nr:hypothetical protein EV421DRAFT_1910327 [Armillaria borealis]